MREQQCQDLIADFLIWQTTNRPYSILKLATTLDGKIATRDGQAAWISGEASRREVHALRTWCGAVIVGGEPTARTIRFLTCRLPEYVGPQPLAVIVSRTLPDPTQRSTCSPPGRDRPSSGPPWRKASPCGPPVLPTLGASVWGLCAWAGNQENEPTLAKGLNCFAATEGAAIH